MLKHVAMVALAPLAFAACGGTGDLSATNGESSETSQSAIRRPPPVAMPRVQSSRRDAREVVPLPLASPRDLPRGPLPAGGPAPESPMQPRAPNTADATEATPQFDCYGATCTDCGDGSFCDLAYPHHCDIRDAPGYCQPQLGASVMCTMVYQPECGCDGKTYANGCARMKAGVAKDFGGPCEGTTGGTTSTFAPFAP